MANRKILGVWIVAGVVAAALVFGLWRPFATAWTCYADWSAEGPEPARVVAASPETGLVLRLTETDAETCTAYLGYVRIEDYAPGDEMRVYRRVDRPGRCEAEASVDAARALLMSLSSVVVVLLLGVVWVAMRVGRRLAAPALTTRFDRPEAPRPASAPLACPRCAKPMEEGYLPLQSGVHWRAVDQPVGFPHPLRGLPGTVGWRNRPRVHAYRCESCEVLTFRYGAKA